MFSEIHYDVQGKREPLNCVLYLWAKGVGPVDCQILCEIQLRLVMPFC